ncbi:MAG: hypothetical protein AAGC88_12290 [Bacteroidota bacterium]
MIKTFTIWLILILLSYSEVIGQDPDNDFAISSFTFNEDISVSELVLESFDQKLSHYRDTRIKASDDTQFLKKLFFGIQRDKLQHYKNNVSLAEMFTQKGSYDCLTGTAVYALILDALGIDFSIKETDFHVYLIVHLDKKDILFEATDPVNGFVENPIVITERVKLYRDGERASELLVSNQAEDASLRIPYRIDRVISLSNLAGLQYYNLALKAFDATDYVLSNELIDLAISLYPNDRFSGFKQIIQIEAAQPVSAIFSNE